jgi:hypothetical protein
MPNKKSKVTIENIEELFPKRIFEHEEQNGVITVLYFEKNPTFVEKVFFKKQLKKPRKIELDEIGSFVWLLCDGTKSVKEITHKAEEHFGEKIKPAKERTELFIEQLYRAKLIELFEKIN